MEDNSHIKLGKRVKRNKLFPLRWQPTDAIPPDEPCILALPGSNAKNSKQANGFAKMIEETLKKPIIPVYSVEYDFDNRDFRLDREAVLARYEQGNPNLPFLREVKEEDKTYIPQYIKELYQMTLAPRLRDENGARVPMGKAAQRLNMLVFANHCQGSTVAQQLEHLMQQDLKDLGYKNSVQAYLLKQVHNVDVAPVSPIGKTQTTTFKFVSFSDETATSVHTPKVEYILKRKQEHERYLANIGNISKDKKLTDDKPFSMNFALFRPTENETIFAVNNIYPIEIQKDEDYEGIEHVFASYSDKDDDDRTKQGDQMSLMFRELLNRLAQNAKNNEKELTEFPDIFKDKSLKTSLSQLQNNRYSFVTKETKILKSRKDTTR